MRVPISIYNITDNVVEFMVKIVGDGTKELTQLKKGYYYGIGTIR